MSSTLIGDATVLPFPVGVFDAVVTSPTYGNRMADHHDARDESRRITYRHAGKHPATWSVEVLARMQELIDCVGALVLDPFAGVGALELELALPGATVIGVELDADWARGLNRPSNKPLHERNSGRMQWGRGYQELHVGAWAEVARVVKMNGAMLLNVSDHVRAGVRQHVVAWHIECLKRVGFERQRIVAIRTPRMGMGANRDVRVPCEYIIVLRRA